MKKLIFILSLIAICNISVAQILYVATDGSDDTGDGSIGSPYATWQKGMDELTGSDTLYIRGGTYYSYELLAVDENDGLSGTYADRTLIAGYPSDIVAGNWPVLDCKHRCDSLPPVAWDIYNSGFTMSKVEYIHLRCFEVRNVWQCDSVLTGGITAVETSNITYERLKVYNIGVRGFWHQSGAWSEADSAYAVDVYGSSPASATRIFIQPDTTRWINCDVWNCMDTLRTTGNRGNGGDAVKTVSYIGNYYYWEGCRSWNYSDDGFDPNGGTREFKNCWVMSSNKYDGFDAFEGNGFKTSTIPNSKAYLSYFSAEDSAQIVKDSLVITKNCLALYCGGVGLYTGLESDTSVNGRWYNNTVWKCNAGTQVALSGNDTIGDIYKNNISWASIQNGGGGNPFNVYISKAYLETNNSWIRKVGYPYQENNPSFTITDADFVSVDSAYLVAKFTAERKADGSLPDSVPLMLAATSELIGGGTPVGLPYNGTAPDLGYSEYDDSDTTIVANFSANSTSIGTGGSVTFTDHSTNSPDTWGWILTNGTPGTSISQNPVIQYNTAGTYNVQLIASKNPTNADTLLRENYITVTDVPVAAFSASSVSIIVGQSVTFTDASTNTPTSWAWVCPGSVQGTSLTQNPTITYNTVGTHSVTLTATNAGGSDDEVKTDYITVTDTPNVSEYKITIRAR